MADQTLAQGIADLRLSTTRLRRDLADARAMLLQAASEIERQVRIDVPVRIDASTARSQLRAVTDQLRADSAQVVIPVNIDADGALAGIQSITDLTGAVTIPVDVDTGAARAALGRLEQDLAITPVNVPVDIGTEPIDDFGSYADINLPPQFAETGAAAGQRFGNSFTSTLYGIFRTSSLALGGFLAGSLVKGFQRLTTIEDATASLTVALGSAAKAGKVLDEVLGVVRGTPFNLDQFAEAASNMISFGIAAEKVPGYLTAIGEAAASKGGRANEFAQRLSLTFGQIAVQGRITNEDIQSLQLTGVDALKILGNNAQTTSFEMREMISKGIIPANEAMDQLADGILNGTTGINGATVAFAGTMGRLRETLTGAIGGFGAATARFGVSIIRPFQDALTSGFNGASEALDVFGAAIEENLGRFADSPAVQSLLDVLSELPQLATNTIEALSGLGPALAPIAAVTAGLGLESLSGFLGPFGNLLPGIAGPIGALTVGITALVAATPELREKAVPVLQELFSIVLEVGGAVVKVSADLIDGLIPALGKTIEVVDGLLPLARGIGLGAVAAISGLAEAIGVLSDILGAFPTPVLTTLVAFFAAYKAFGVAERIFDPLQADLLVLDGLSERVGPTSKLSKGLSAIGVSAESAANAVSLAMVAATGAISGFALASEDSTAQITGAIGAISSVALGFAQGGAVGAAIAGIGVGVGVIAGKFVEAKQRAAEFKAEFEGLADKLIYELNLSSEAIDNFRIGDQGTFDIFLNGLKDIEGFGDEAVVVAENIGLSLAAALKIPEDQFDDALAIVARLRENLKETALLAGLQDPESSRVAGGLATERVELARQLKLITGEQVSLDGTNLALVEEMLKLLEKQNAAALLANTYAEKERDTRQQVSRNQLEALGFLSSTIDVIIAKSAEANKDPLKLIEDPQVILDLFDNIKNDPALLNLWLGVTDGAYNFEQQLQDIKQTQNDLIFQTDQWAAALAGVGSGLDSVGSILGNVTAAGDALSSISGIGGFLSQIVNEAEIRDAERIADQIDRQYERIQTATDRLRDAARDFQFDEQIALERIAEAESVGATRGAAALRKQLEADRQKVQDLADAAAEEQAKLAELQAQRGSTTPITLGQILEQQAADLNLSLGDLILQQPTAEAQQAWRALASGPLRAILQAVEGAAQDDPAAAADLLGTLLGQWETALEGTDILGTGLIQGITSGLDKTKIGYQALGYAKDFIGALNGPGGLDEEEALQFKTNLADFDFSAEQLQIFEDAIQALDPTIFVGIELVEGTIDALQGEIASSAYVVPVSYQVPDNPNVNPNTNPAIVAAELRQDAVLLLAQLLTDAVGTLSKRGGKLFFSGSGSILNFFKDGGQFGGPENHIAHIARNTIRVFAEPETGGEAYIPLAPGKRPRSERILGDVATMFGLEVSRRVAMPSGGPTVASIGDTSRIEAAVARGIAAGMATQQRSAIAERYDRAVNVEHLHVGRDPSDRRLARRVVNDLAELALRL